MRSIKVISFISLVVLGLSTISCKDELVDVSCVDEALAIEYKIEVDLINEQDAQLGSEANRVWIGMYYSPVCGCDNKTYSNDHEAKLEGIFIFTEGDCENE